MNNQTNSPETTETIFSDVFDTTPYEKSLKNARIWLFVIAGFQAAMGIFEYVTIDDKTVGLVALGIDVFVGLIFLALALWSRKKPYLSFVLSLSFYVLFNVGFMILDTSNIGRGWLIKIFVVMALVKAIRDAKKYEELKAATM